MKHSGINEPVKSHTRTLVLLAAKLTSTINSFPGTGVQKNPSDQLPKNEQAGRSDRLEFV